MQKEAQELSRRWKRSTAKHVITKNLLLASQKFPEGSLARIPVGTEIMCKDHTKKHWNFWNTPREYLVTVEKVGVQPHSLTASVYWRARNGELHFARVKDVEPVGMLEALAETGDDT